MALFDTELVYFGTYNLESLGPVLSLNWFCPVLGLERRGSRCAALLRAAAERTVDAPWTTIGSLIGRFTPDECANYFAAAGYDAT